MQQAHIELSESFVTPAVPAPKITTAGGSAIAQELERMARRRYQHPRPFREGHFWWALTWANTPGTARKRQRVKLAPASTPEREILKILADRLRPINQGLITAGSAVNFMHFITDTWEKTTLPLLAMPVQACYQGAIRRRLEPAFGDCALRDLTPVTLQSFFSRLHQQRVSYPTIVKVRDALSSVLRAAVQYEFLAKNPIEGLRLPPDKRGEIVKPWISPQQFFTLIELIPEPYATMVVVAVFAGLRVSELAGLQWHCLGTDSISIERRYTRGDWSCTKTPGSAKPVSVHPSLIARIHGLKSIMLDVRAGRAVRHYQAVKASRPDDLVFQSVKDGRPMNDQNILKRHIQPAAERLGFRVHWRALRTSCATWNVACGNDVKSTQAQMRHSNPQLTLEVYAQFVADNQHQAAVRLWDYAQAENARSNHVPLTFQ